MIFLLVLAYAVLIAFEVPKLVREKSWRELVAYSVLMSLAFALCVLKILNIEVWNPVKTTQYFVKSLWHLSYD